MEKAESFFSEAPYSKRHWLSLNLSIDACNPSHNSSRILGRNQWVDSKNNMEKQSDENRKRVGKEVGRLMLPDFQIYYRAATTKTHGERDAGINRRESRNRSHILANCFSTKVYRHINGKRKASSTDIAGATGHLYINRLPYTLHLRKKIKPKLIMELM